MKITSIEATIYNVPIHVPILEKDYDCPIVFVRVETMRAPHRSVRTNNT
jgi:hypothetical protein